MKVLNKYVTIMDRPTLVKIKQLCHYFGEQEACSACDFFSTEKGCRLTYDSNWGIKILIPEDWNLPEANRAIQHKPILNTGLVINKMRDLMNRCPKKAFVINRRDVHDENSCKNCPMYKISCKV